MSNFDGNRVDNYETLNIKQFITFKKGKYDGNRVDTTWRCSFKGFKNTLYQLKSKNIQCSANIIE